MDRLLAERERHKEMFNEGRKDRIIMRLKICNLGVSIYTKRLERRHALATLPADEGRRACAQCSSEIRALRRSRQHLRRQHDALLSPFVSGQLMEDLEVELADEKRTAEAIAKHLTSFSLRDSW